MYTFNGLLKLLTTMKTVKFLLLLFPIILIGTFARAQKPNVEGIWKIKSLKDSGKMIEVGSKETTVEMKSKEKSILVYVGCNRLTSKLEFITGDKIQPFVLSATRKSCKDNIETLESSTRYVLEQTNSIRKNGAKMEFFKDNDLLMVLERPVNNGKKKK